MATRKQEPMAAPLFQVGGQIFPEGIFIEIADAIVLVLEKGHDTRADQETIREALNQFAQLAKVEHVAVTNSTFTNNPGPAVTCQ